MIFPFDCSENIQFFLLTSENIQFFPSDCSENIQFFFWSYWKFSYKHKCYTLHLSGPLKPCIYTCYTTIHFFLLTNLEYFSFIQTNKFKDTSLLKNLKYCRAVEEHWFIVYIQTLPGTWTC
jgi:hypothetical protein